MTEEKLKEMRERLNSKEGKRAMSRFVERLVIKEKVESRWGEMFMAMSSDERRNVFSRISDKYDSKEYIDREYKRGYEPRCPLAFTLFTVFKKYGEEVSVELNFPGECYKLDDMHICVMYGQGTMILLFNNSEKFNEWADRTNRM